MSDPGHGLTPKQARAVAALLASSTHEAAAAAAKISTATLRRWLAEPLFQQALRDGRQELVERTVGWLQTASTSAVAALVRNLSCSKPAVEVSAATAILDRALKGYELLGGAADLVARIEELERQVLPRKGA
jgi:hypothetical protein